MSDPTESLEGHVPDLPGPAALFDALERAFDYRGDITVTLHDGSQITGYLFDRTTGQGLDDSLIRIMPADGSANVSIPYAEVAALKFADRDPASGKSWENWLKRYAEAKRKGEAANIESEKLD
jgi:hypothetical protein